MLQDIQNKLGDCSVFSNVDETMDPCGRHVANLVIGKLCGEKL